MNYFSLTFKMLQGSMAHCVSARILISKIKVILILLKYVLNIKMQKQIYITGGVTD